MFPIEKELKIATDFLNEVCDHIDTSETSITRNDVLAGCKKVIGQLGLTETYDMFRTAFDPNAIYALSDDRKGLRLVTSDKPR